MTTPLSSGNNRVIAPPDPLERLRSLVNLPLVVAWGWDPTGHVWTVDPAQGVFAFRVEQRGKAIVYATDTEHYEGRVDDELLKLARNAELLIYDSQYTPEEYEGTTVVPPRASATRDSLDNIIITLAQERSGAA